MANLKSIKDQIRLGFLYKSMIGTPLYYHQYYTLGEIVENPENNIDHPQVYKIIDKKGWILALDQPLYSLELEDGDVLMIVPYDLKEEEILDEEGNIQILSNRRSNNEKEISLFIAPNYVKGYCTVGITACKLELSCKECPYFSLNSAKKEVD